MAKGGKREGAGRKKKPTLPFVGKDQSTRVIEYLGKEYRGKKLPTEDDLWLTLICGGDPRLRFDVLKYLTDRRYGKATQPIDHGAGGPIKVEITTNVKM